MCMWQAELYFGNTHKSKCPQEAEHLLPGTLANKSVVILYSIHHTITTKV